jgi:hypothetical protein
MKSSSVRAKPPIGLDQVGKLTQNGFHGERGRTPESNHPDRVHSSSIA